MAGAVCRATRPPGSGDVSRRTGEAGYSDSGERAAGRLGRLQGPLHGASCQRIEEGGSRLSGSITIVIPSFNRMRALEAVWPSYLRHPDVARIIVVDDGSTDGTKGMVERLAGLAPVPVHVIRHEERRGQPASRMTGI